MSVLTEALARSRSASLPLGLIALGAVLLAVLPLLAVRIPPLFDLPAHVARLAVLLDDGASPYLDAIFDIHWSVLPNLALEMVTLPVAPLIGLDAAVTTFLVLAVLLQLLGVTLLAWAVHRRLTALPFLSVFLLYNNVLNFGFVGYVFTVGLYLITFALWILLRERTPAMRLPVFAGLACLLFVAHLYGLGLFGLSAGAYELGRGIAAKRSGRSWHEMLASVAAQLGLLAASTLPPILLFLTLSTTGRAVAVTTWADIFSFEAWAQKPEKLLYALEAGITSVDRILLAGLALALVAGFATRTIRFSGQLVLPLVFLGLAFLFMPTLLVSSWGADLRLPVVLGLVTVAALDWRSGAQARPQRLLIAALATLCVLRTASVVASWVPADRTLTAIRSAFELLPRGSSLMLAVPLEDCWGCWVDMPFYHFGGYAVVDRQVFYPTVFVEPGAQPIRFTPPCQAKRHASGAMEWDVDYLPEVKPGLVPEPRALALYDYVLVIEPERFGNKLSPQLETVKRGKDFALMRVRRPGQEGPMPRSGR